MRYFIFILALLLAAPVFSVAQPLERDGAPFIGAQVFVEPGQTDAQVDGWFRILRDNGMGVCRIRMFESYMADGRGGYDFSLFDRAFKAAEKYGIKVYATLFPETDRTDIGGWKYPYDSLQLNGFARFIEAVAVHFRTSPALQGWVLLNEPGQSRLPDSPFIRMAREGWMEDNPLPDFTPDGYPVLVDMRNGRFQMDMNTRFLGWIADTLEKYDDAHDIHVNPHGIFSSYPQYDLAAWRPFLTSLGGSAHASWHFRNFDRQQYALAMLANAEMLRSGAGDLPWFMTELQGGNNVYSGGEAMCPTPDEIMQWLWIVAGTEGKGGIFWMLNPRSSGPEAGEWALLDFQGRPTPRVDAIRKVAGAWTSHKNLLGRARLEDSGVDVVYFRESGWAENLMCPEGDDRYEARQTGASMKSAVSCFRALTERGLNVGLRSADEYDFSPEDFSGRTMIISNQICIPWEYRSLLGKFVSGGGTLIVEGLSAFYDEYLRNTMTTGFMFRDLFGCNVSGFVIRDSVFAVRADSLSLPAFPWHGILESSPAMGQGRPEIMPLFRISFTACSRTGPFLPSGFPDIRTLCC